jgi:hypothetical protein
MMAHKCYARTGGDPGGRRIDVAVVKDVAGQRVKNVKDALVYPAAIDLAAKPSVEVISAA